MWHSYYKIHDLLDIEISGEDDYKKGKDLRHAYFKTDKAYDPDIRLYMGKFEPDNRDCQEVSHRYQVKNNYLYCAFSSWKAIWKMEIRGFEAGKVDINFHGRSRQLKGLLFPSFLPQDILIPVIEQKLMQNNYLLIHGGALTRDEQSAYIFIGRRGAMKSTIIINLLRNGYQLIGDDRFIITDDKILSFPISPFLISYGLDNMATEARSLKDNICIVKNMMQENKTYDLPVINSSAPKAIFFVERKERQGTKISKLSRAEATRKIILNNMLEMNISSPETPAGYYLQFMKAYSFIFPNSRIASYWDDFYMMLGKYLQSIPCFSLEIPLRYDSTVQQRIELLIENFK
ncbi:hypothetical protein ACFLUF_02330 [Chloroflexota bacterium]